MSIGAHPNFGFRAPTVYGGVALRNAALDVGQRAAIYVVSVRFSSVVDGLSTNWANSVTGHSAQVLTTTVVHTNELLDHVEITAKKTFGRFFNEVLNLPGAVFSMEFSI